MTSIRRSTALAPVFLAALALAVLTTVVAAAPSLGSAAQPAPPPLRVTYGPYLGIRCHHVGHRGCNMVGVDVVLDRAATRVVVRVGPRRTGLRTPGLNTGVRRHDWVGTFRRARIGRPGSPFRFHAPGPVYVGVEVLARYADGTGARAWFPHVLLAPGWG